MKPSLVNIPSMEEGGLLLVGAPITMLKFILPFDLLYWSRVIVLSMYFQYLRMLAVAYEKTQELARDLRAVGCGDLDVEGNN